MDAFIDAVTGMIARGWTDFLARPDGKLSLRFYIQPAMAALLAIRAGISDVKEGHGPLLVSIVMHREKRGHALRSSWTHVSKVFLVSVVLDGIYQLVTHHSIYVLELLFTACCLAILPYALVRGPAYRLVRYWNSNKGLADQKSSE